jgi:hypothetical protein
VTPAKKRVAKRRRIVKVQLSLSTTEPVPQVLVYDKPRAWFWQGRADENLAALMGTRKKAFFYATRRRDGQLSIDAEAKERPW